ncbi:MAG: signal peptidase I [Candidatus Staskawiczbacteria bacterium RIFCSPLOWO2_01_FULL_38_12b]|uniref:Signal peptidase I n=1 Tax=Candidatus Staskawiczbacteria bacterium RIFCSPLOWO2_01_FULL_38_12b TaxID=1802214 RepID=A0A1G2ICP9_9BACT|nr:MAG: signal peptidase I [Candidatus Staskawiczbacteria bacterium RIFCSPLOWO2_01_FULL_38_12b]
MEENTTTNNPPEQPKENGGIIKKRLPFLWELLKIIVVAVIIVVPIRYFIFQPFIVRGESMVPNLQSGDYLIVDELSYRIGDPQRGDIVVLKYPLDITQKFIKRVIGLPGETVQVKNGKIHILKDGKSLVLDEKKYLPLLESTDGDVTIVLEKDMYFVLGDNRQFSYDSRRWGVLPEKDIIGRALFRVFPLMTISYISAPSY